MRAACRVRAAAARAAQFSIAAGLAVGTLFSLAQQARGAHCLSHDLWSAWLVSLICAALYIGPFGARLWPDGEHRSQPRGDGGPR